MVAFKLIAFTVNQQRVKGNARYWGAACVGSSVLAEMFSCALRHLRTRTQQNSPVSIGALKIVQREGYDRQLPSGRFTRCRDLYRQCMHTIGQFIGQRVIDGTVPRKPHFTGKRGRNNAHAKVRFAAAINRATLMTGMQMALIDHVEPLRLERVGQFVTHGGL